MLSIPRATCVLGSGCSCGLPRARLLAPVLGGCMQSHTRVNSLPVPGRLYKSKRHQGKTLDQGRRWQRVFQGQPTSVTAADTEPQQSPAHGQKLLTQSSKGNPRCIFPAPFDTWYCAQTHVGSQLWQRPRGFEKRRCCRDTSSSAGPALGHGDPSQGTGKTAVGMDHIKPLQRDFLELISQSPS